LCSRKSFIWRRFRGSTKTLRVMKLTAILLLGVALTVSANTVSQTITLSAKNISLEKAFSELEKQTGFVVIYSLDVIEKTSPVSIAVRDEPIGSFLNKILNGQSLGYAIENKTISIKKK